MAEEDTRQPALQPAAEVPAAAGQTVTVRVRYDTTEVAFASQFVVSAGAEEIVVGVSPGFVTDPASKENLLPIHSRIAMTPGGARRLIQALGNALAGIENAAQAGSSPGPADREAGLPKLNS